MKEQLIKFETAKLAKEKGFKAGSYTYYDNGAVLVNSITRINNKMGLVSAPTQSLLQKWLREQYAIHIELIPDEKDPKNLWHTIVYPLYCMKEPSNEGVFETYEEALEKGLIEALKLITC